MEMKDIKLYTQYNNTIWNQKLHDSESCQYCVNNNNNNSNCKISFEQLRGVVGGDQQYHQQHRQHTTHPPPPPHAPPAPPPPNPPPPPHQQHEQTKHQQRHIMTSLYDYYLYHLKTT